MSHTYDATYTFIETSGQAFLEWDYGRDFWIERVIIICTGDDSSTKLMGSELDVAIYKADGTFVGTCNDGTITSLLNRHKVDCHNGPMYGSKVAIIKAVTATDPQILSLNGLAVFMANCGSCAENQIVQLDELFLSFDKILQTTHEVPMYMDLCPALACPHSGSLTLNTAQFSYSDTTRMITLGENTGEITATFAFTGDELTNGG